MRFLPTGSFQTSVYRGLIQGGLLKYNNNNTMKIFTMTKQFVCEH